MSSSRSVIVGIIAFLATATTGCARGADSGPTLFMECRGRGEPAVVLEAGASLDSSDWAEVQPKAARYTRVCAYDRPGLGRSERFSREEPEAPDAELASLLHELLAREGVQPPFVLVGHSLGGYYVRRYERAYPRDVAGLVLVDSVSGLERRVGEKPVVVLSAGRADEASFDSPDQERLSRLSTNSAFVAATTSGHLIEHDQPDLVVEAIRVVFRAVRRDSRVRCGRRFERLGGRCLTPGS